MRARSAGSRRFFGVAKTINGITEEGQREDYALLLTELAGFETPDIIPVIEFLAAHLRLPTELIVRESAPAPGAG